MAWIRPLIITKAAQSVFFSSTSSRRFSPTSSAPSPSTTRPRSDDPRRPPAAAVRDASAKGDHRQMIPAVDHGPLHTLPSHERLPRTLLLEPAIALFARTTSMHRSPELAAHMHAPSELPSPACRQRGQRRRRPLFCIEGSRKSYSARC
ncbi:hypothetical protein ACLOJK_029856 [Asimina triloba]